jgi:hypothetical protein
MKFFSKFVVKGFIRSAQLKWQSGRLPLLVVLMMLFLVSACSANPTPQAKTPKPSVGTNSARQTVVDNTSRVSDKEWPRVFAFMDDPELGQIGTWSYLIEGDRFIEIHFQNSKEYGPNFGYHYHETYNFKSVNNNSFTVKEEDGSAEYTVKYSLSDDGNRLTITDNGGISSLDNDVYHKMGSIVWTPALLGAFANGKDTVKFANHTDDYSNMILEENNCRLVEIGTDSFKVLGPMNMLMIVKYSLNGDILTLTFDEEDFTEYNGTYRKQ